MSPQLPAMQFDHVDVAFGRHMVLRQLQFDIPAGAFVGVIGPNGAGKTTMIRLVLGLQRPNAGRVTVLGQSAGRGGREIGYVPQSFAAEPDLPLRARDLVGLGLDGEKWGFPLPSKERRRRIDACLERVGALGYADEAVGTLSGGERQRLLIAQALLTSPRILLLDEPLANLDIRSGHDIIHLIAEIAKETQITVLFVAHDMNPLLGVMDQVLYIAQGRALLGSVEQVVRSDVLSELYGQPVEVVRVQGRILVFAGDEMVPLGHEELLPHGRPRSLPVEP
ncbi:MAG TPA: ABC transporter ATP-binding protein [Candidatus Nanopelagicaceae bacterium]|nr:ABC transporter ATP-binding protein [Candidatus Nanopelagicaceae bacterium]